MRAFLNHYEDLLDDSSRWIVPRAEQLVAQLASQEPHTLFASAESGTLDDALAAMPTAIIKRKSTPQARRRCRWTVKASNELIAVAISPDGSRLVHVTGLTVAVLNCQTGLVVSQLYSGCATRKSHACHGRQTEPKLLRAGGGGRRGGS